VDKSTVMSVIKVIIFGGARVSSVAEIGPAYALRGVA
jgi:hypothetical protein